MTSDIPTLQKYDALDGKTFLVCVGAMKCATSWLYNYLGALPEVAVSPLKELHFFSAKFPANALGDMEALAIRRLGFHIEQEGDPVHNLLRRPAFQASVDRARMIYDDDAYFAHFARLCTPETRTVCDMTPAYSAIGPEGFTYMKDFCAAQDVRVRILFVMRDPVDRLWSQLRHLTQVRPDADMTGNWAEALDSPRIMARADYRGTIWDIEEAFAAEDVLYLFYEDLFDATTLGRLCDFVGAAYRPGDPDEVHNRTELTLHLPEDARDAFRRTLEHQYSFCRARFGDRVPSTWMT